MAEEWDEEYGQIPQYARGFAIQRVPVSQIASPFINPIRQERIDELAELEDEGYELPPVILDGPGEVEEVDYPEEKYPFLDGHYPVVGEDVWYVHDGHHRVTLAIQRGQRFIDALIIGTSNEMERNGPSPLDNPAFRRWFGDSKVVDEDGQPLVVYHGTRADFDVFKRPATPGMDRFGPGFYFSADPTTLRAFHGDSGREIATYLRIERPTRGEMTADQIRRFFSAIKTTRFPNGYDAKEDHRRLMRECLADPSRAFLFLAESAAFKVYFTEEDVIRGMAAAGIDGVIVSVHGYDEYVVFDPRQIKSATDNAGTFDPDDPSILRNPSITETPSFKAWFKDSKVRDRRKGNAPLVVYHGTPDGRGIFSEGFRRSPMRGDAFFATDSYAMAASYADANRAWDYQNAEPGVIPLYLSIQSPLAIDWGGKEWRGTEKWIAKAREQGADGLIVHDVVDYYNDNFGRGRKKSATVYVWFSPTQAKSAAAGPIKQSGLGAMAGEVIAGSGPNEGTFDPADPVITKNRRTSKRTSRRRR